MAGIYIHIPFCKQACYYCDFHFSTSINDRQPIVDAIVKEISLRKDYLTESVSTIYFGGGTPSILDQSQLIRLLEEIHRHFNIRHGAEITLEANPDDLHIKKLKMLKQIGVNRLSVGIQSFDDTVLKYLNRPHSAEEALRSVSDAFTVGFDNISIDLIYSIPQQDNELWKKNLKQAIDLEVQHISSYSLTIEPKTTFGNWLKKGKLNTVSDDHSAVQFEIMVDALTEGGFEHYEVSNFCKPGFYSRHNSSYWKSEQYLGVGPSAHSFDLKSRQYNVSNNALYQKALEQNLVPAETEILSREDKVNEYLLTTLRTMWGSDLTFLKDHFQLDLIERNRDYVDLLLQKSYAVLEGNTLKLTPTGKLLADKIASDLFLEKSDRLV